MFFFFFQNHLKTLQQDIADLLGGEEEYIDDDINKPDKPPPPYPESEGEIIYYLIQLWHQYTVIIFLNSEYEKMMLKLHNPDKKG